MNTHVPAYWVGSAVLGLALAALFSSSCGDEGGPGAASTGAGGATVSAATTTASSTASTGGTLTAGGTEAGACDPRPLPPAVPEGWVEDTDWSCDCRFYLPASKSALPASIAWAACPVNPAGLDCQAMVTDWTDSTAPVGVVKMDRNPDGSAVLLIERGHENPKGDSWIQNVVADADGNVRSAVMQAWSGMPFSSLGCVMTPEGFNEGYWVLFIRGSDQSAKLGQMQGAIAGSVDDLHPTLLPGIEEHMYSDNWECSSKWLFREGAGFVETAFPWGSDAGVFVTSPAVDPDGLTPSQTIAVGDALFWETATTALRGINSWDPKHGARPFIRWIGDGTNGAGNLGTDGKALVWSYGEGKSYGDDVYPTASVMTAPFTTDPATLQPRRLRSQPGSGIGALDTWHVGCGLAAINGWNQDVFVVRISDGVAWTIPSVLPDIHLFSPLGLTCDEIFVLGTVGGRETVLRMKLDKLGPGMPAD